MMKKTVEEFSQEEEKKTSEFLKQINVSVWNVDCCNRLVNNYMGHACG